MKEWIARYGDPRDPKVDPIDWVERIPFSETRNYVQRVLENLQVYRVRFGGGAKLLIEADLPRRSRELMPHFEASGLSSPSWPCPWRRSRQAEHDQLIGDPTAVRGQRSRPWRSRASGGGRRGHHLHVLQALEDGQGETMAGHAAGDRIPRRTLGQEARAEGLAQRALPVGIGSRVRRRVCDEGAETGEMTCASIV